MDHLTVTEAAQALHLSVPTVKRYIYEGKLQSAKLPGGQHRIPMAEVQRLLGSEPAPAREAAAGSSEDRVQVLEQWVTDLQAEVERLTAALEVVSRYCARKCGAAPPDSPDGPAGPGAGPVLLVLGPGCRHCDILHEMTVAALEALNRPEAAVHRVESLDGIADFGPVLTPALVLEDEIILSGRIPTQAALEQLLRKRLPPPPA